MTTPDPNTWCEIHHDLRERCGCVLSQRYALTKKCVECDSPTAAPREVRGRLYCQEHGAEAAAEWGAWIVYDFDMGYKVRAIFPHEIDALRHAQKDGYFQYVKWVSAGELDEQLSKK